MNQGFIDILKKLTDEQGKEALLNPAKCKALLADYTKGEYKKESRLLLQAIDAGVQKEIITTAELELCKRQQTRVLHEEYGMDQAVAANVVDTLALVLRGEQAMPQGAFCSNCGKELQKGWGVCPYCGTTVKAQQNTTQTKPQPLPSPAPIMQTSLPPPAIPLAKKKNTKRNLIIAGAVLLVILIIVIVNGTTSTPAVESSSAKPAPAPASTPKPAPPAQTAIPANFVRVEGGTFQMGTPSGGENNERPVHTVKLKSFYMGKYEVTQKEWLEIMGTNPSYFKGDNLPVEDVSWYDAAEYCNKRSIREGLTPAYSGSGDNITCDWNANGYRLPTEAEWEYTAKGGNGSPGNYTYSGSNTIGDVAWYEYNSEGRTHAVGTKTANGLGIHDMSGNVWEWCWDWYGGYSSDSQIDPRGAVSGADRVNRGGSWFNSAAYVRSAIRGFSTPSNRNLSIGFRLVRSYM